MHRVALCRIVPSRAPVLSLLALFLMLGSAGLLQAGIVSGPDVIPAPPFAIDDAPGAENMNQQGFDEAQDVVLVAPLPVDGGTIPAGTVVDSHMIFLNTPGLLEVSDQGQVWTFDGPVLGVMSDARGTLEAASSPFLGAPGTVYPGSFDNRGMESDPLDNYTVSGNTISVGMHVSEPGDWIRVVTAGEACGDVVDDFDYMGFGPDRCAPSNVRVVVTNEAELAQYHTDFGYDPATGRVKNLLVKFNPSGEVEIHSPCEVFLGGDLGMLDVLAENVRIFGKKGVAVANDVHRPDIGIMANGEILLVSEYGSAAFFDELFISAGRICVQARDNAKIGAFSHVDVRGPVELVSLGDGTARPRGVAGIRQHTHVMAEELRIDGPIAILQQVTFVQVAGNFEMQASAPEKCRIDGSAFFLAGSTSGNCLEAPVECPCWMLETFRFFDIDFCEYELDMDGNVRDDCVVRGMSAMGPNDFVINLTASGFVCDDTGSVLDLTPISQEEANVCCEILLDASAMDNVECQLD